MIMKVVITTYNQDIIIVILADLLMLTIQVYLNSQMVRPLAVICLVASMILSKKRR